MELIVLSYINKQGGTILPFSLPTGTINDGLAKNKYNHSTSQMYS